MDHFIPINHNEDNKIRQDIFKEQNEIPLLCCPANRKTLIKNSDKVDASTICNFSISDTRNWKTRFRNQFLKTTPLTKSLVNSVTCKRYPILSTFSSSGEVESIKSQESSNLEIFLSTVSICEKCECVENAPALVKSSTRPDLTCHKTKDVLSVESIQEVCPHCLAKHLSCDNQPQDNKCAVSLNSDISLSSTFIQEIDYQSVKNDTSAVTIKMPSESLKQKLIQKGLLKLPKSSSTHCDHCTNNCQAVVVSRDYSKSQQILTAKCSCFEIPLPPDAVKTALSKDSYSKRKKTYVSHYSTFSHQSNDSEEKLPRCTCCDSLKSKLSIVSQDDSSEDIQKKFNGCGKKESFLVDNYRPLCNRQPDVIPFICQRATISTAGKNHQDGI
ncbi:uncharacterized protein LOC123296497 [Chrysoperla carnea]|uniref:uncharacterized protein LOC123296497 n=1 Tax=Chrysoperla carnea TaxID=189513 RepID=UPI001D089930|nr:uncharacterized protein LOC123296497 [Chrysoperla carnea]